MSGNLVRHVGRWAVAGAGIALVAGLQTGVAMADDFNVLKAPRVALINTGQIDDPMEDVLEHTLNFGDGYKWD